MPRPLDYVLEEIVRVCEHLGYDDPRDSRFTVKKFLTETDVTDHDLRQYGSFTKVKQDAAHAYGIQPDKNSTEARGVELRNNYVRGLERKVATKNYIANKLLEGLEDVFERNPISLPNTNVNLRKNFKNKRTLTLLLSDLHFGVDIDNREVLGNEYNWKIASRRIAKLCEQAALWKPSHRKETTLKVILNGDIIHGVVHLNDSNIRNLTEQVWGATAVLSKALAFLSTQFPSVEVICLPGNHDRVTYKDSGRATAQRWDAHSSQIYLALKMAFKDSKVVNIDVPMSSIGSYTTPGNNLVIATHGDVEPGVGNVGKSFNVTQTMQSIQKLNASKVFDRKIDVVLFGHWHQPSMFMLSDGTICIVNGCLNGSDTFAQNGVGEFNTMPAQVMFESVEEYPVGDFRIVQLKDADNVKKYDKIINIPNIEKGGLIDF